MGDRQQHSKMVQSRVSRELTGQGRPTSLLDLLCWHDREGDIIVASASKSKLWRDMRWNGAIQVWNMKYFDIFARSPGSPVRLFTH